jgi:hypothetical protein
MGWELARAEPKANLILYSPSVNVLIPDVFTHVQRSTFHLFPALSGED